MTRQLLRWRGVLMGLALFLTLMPLSFGFKGGQVNWIFFNEAPAALIALICAGAVASWTGFFYVRRRLAGTGL